MNQLSLPTSSPLDYYVNRFISSSPSNITPYTAPDSLALMRDEQLDFPPAALNDRDFTLVDSTPPKKPIPPSPPIAPLPQNIETFTDIPEELHHDPFLQNIRMNTSLCCLCATQLLTKITLCTSSKGAIY